MISTDSYFILFTNCIPVKGDTTSLIYDLQKGTQFKIPNLLYKVLEQSRNHTIEQLKRFFDNQYDEGIDSYFNLLLEKGLGFYTDFPNSFPLLSTEYASSQKLAYCLIELSEENASQIKAVIADLNILGVKYVQIRDIRKFPLRNLESILAPLTKKFGILAVEIFTKYSDANLIQKAIKLAKEMPHINKVVILNAPEKKSFKISTYSRKDHVFLVIKDYDEFFVEKMSKNKFLCSVQSFSESHHKNLGINHKLCVTRTGAVKNHFRHTKSFGSIFESTISNILETSGIRQQWDIPKFKVENCKNCIYRYCCTFSAEVVLHEDKYFLKDNCNYDPKQDIWIS